MKSIRSRADTLDRWIFPDFSMPVRTDPPCFTHEEREWADVPWRHHRIHPAIAAPCHEQNARVAIAPTTQRTHRACEAFPCIDAITAAKELRSRCAHQCVRQRCATAHAGAFGCKSTVRAMIAMNTMSAACCVLPPRATAGGRPHTLSECRHRARTCQSNARIRRNDQRPKQWHTVRECKRSIDGIYRPRPAAAARDCAMLFPDDAIAWKASRDCTAQVLLDGKIRSRHGRLIRLGLHLQRCGLEVLARSGVGFIKPAEHALHALLQLLTSRWLGGLHHATAEYRGRRL